MKAQLKDLPAVRLAALLVVCALALYALVGAALTSPFSIIDDHGVVEYLMHPVSLAAQMQADLTDNGRFRPLYWIIRQSEYQGFGANPLLWHVFVFALGVVTLALIYRLLRRFVPPIYAAFGILLLFFYPGSSAIWYKLAVQETIGVLLTVAALLAFADHHDTLFVVLIVLAGADKESFALLIPALLTLYVIVRGRIVSPQSFALLLFGGLFAAMLLLVKLGAADSYGAVITGSPGMRSIDNLVLLMFPTFGLAPLLLAIPQASRRERWGALIVLALWLIPQAVLYSADLEERYFWPAILAPTLIVPLAFYRLRRARSRLIFGIAVVLMLVLIPFDAYGILNQRSGAEIFFAQNTQFQAQMQQIARDNPPSVHFDYPLPNDEELRDSTRSFLTWYGYTGKIDFGCTDQPYC